MRNKKVISILLAFTVVFTLGTSNVFGSQSEDLNSMRIGVTVEMDSLSPMISYSQIGYEVFSLIYDSLVTIDENLEPVPNLAKSWEISEDGTEWTFKLEEGVKWHDREPFTSNDVKFTYELLLDNPLGMYAGYLGGITEITCPDDYTVVIKTENPKANMLLNSAPILPEHIWKDVPVEELETWPNEMPIGTGPFGFVEFNAGQFLKLASNENYFKGEPSIDELIFVLYANSDTMAQSIKIGEIDAATNFNTSQLTSLKEEASIEAISAVSLGFTELSFNAWKDPTSNANPLLKDYNIRKAIEYTINKQQILDLVYDGQGSVGTTLVPPEGFYHYDPTGDELRSYDIEKAKQLLETSGYTDLNGDGIREDKDGNPLEFTFTLRADNSEEVKAGQMISGSAADAGIKLNIETVDDGVLIDKIYSGDFDMFIWGWGADLDPTTILNVMTTDQIGSMSDSNYSNTDYDDLFIKQQTLMDPDERQQAVWEMQQILYEEAPYIILFYDNSLQAVNTEKWTGWKRIPETGGFFFNLTNYNYLNVKPVAQTTTTTDNTQNTTTEDTGGSSNTMLYVLGGIVIVAGIFVVMRKKKN
ncbi:MAG: ABC transporter substrate-binding protein [Gudongella sp.]|nr:ABC transporter substrate-binding protein [Gudongella sp.]